MAADVSNMLLVTGCVACDMVQLDSIISAIVKPALALALQAMLLLQMVTIATHIDTADTPVQSKHKPV